MITTDFIERCIAKAIAGESKCTAEILALEGFSSARVRHFLNNLCEAADVRYAEVGVWQGSTFCAANYGNTIQAVAIDNFSEFAGQRESFLKNYADTVGGQPDLREQDFQEFAAQSEQSFNVYFYDGNHTLESQISAITAFYPRLDDEFVLIVDDADWSEVKAGTQQGLAEKQLKCLTTWELASGGMNDASTWWNGLFVAICRKP